jgi:hypothetical protein
VKRWITATCAALFAATNLCSLVLSASSTLAKAEAVGVPGSAVWSAVGVLELVSLAGTLRWLTATTKRGRLHAVVVVGLVAVVTGVAGWAAYGWFGLVAPLAVIATLHMIVETLNDLAATPDEQDNQDDQDNLEPQWGPPAAVTTPALEPEPVRPQLEPVRWSVDQIAADLREQGQTNPSGQYIRKTYSVGKAKADQVLARLNHQEVAS